MTDLTLDQAPGCFLAVPAASFRAPFRACSGGYTGQQFHFGDFTLDQSRYRLQRGERFLRLEKLPMELLIFLLERPGELVSREEIATRLWGKDVFLDTDHSINTAIRKIRQVLHDDPDKPRFLETVVGKGYRFAAPVTVNGNSVPVQRLPPTEVLAPPDAIPQKHRSPWAMIAASTVLVAFVVGGSFLLRNHGVKASASPQIKSIAVLPLENLSGDRTQDYLADGMTEALIGRLAGIRNLRVISRTSIMQFKQTRLSVPEIAKMLGGVDAIVEGSVIRDGNRVRVHAQLIRASTDTHIWAETYDREMEDALALQSDLAQAIANRVEVTISGEERTRLVATRNVSPEVYESYLKGRFTKSDSREDVETSIAYFQDSIDKDPTFAPAYVGLASSYESLGTIFIGAPPDLARTKEVSAARKALELDSSIAEAHTLLANVYVERWQWTDADAEFKQAIHLNPNDAQAHIGYASLLMCQGRFDDAFRWAERAHELDPLGDNDTQVGWILFTARRYDDAIRKYRSVLAIHPDDAATLWYLGFALIAKGEPEQAIAPLEKALSVSRRSPGVIGVLIRAYAHAGRRTEALRLLAELKKRRQSGYLPAGAFVNAYLGLGDNEQAFVWLEQAYKEHSNILQFIKVHPYFDPIRSDPRFADLMHRVGLDAAPPQT
ncbi:MAG TPA: tetratricopeptide repeat protein [Terriglobales bacterium]|nr:tetratricopeptide repeat protein [Terriglobales bacterium]